MQSCGSLWPPGASERINEVFVMFTGSLETRSQSTLELVAEMNLTSKEWREWGCGNRAGRSSHSPYQSTVPKPEK